MKKSLMLLTLGGSLFQAPIAILAQESSMDSAVENIVEDNTMVESTFVEDDAPIENPAIVFSEYASFVFEEGQVLENKNMFDMGYVFDPSLRLDPETDDYASIFENDELTTLQQDAIAADYWYQFYASQVTPEQLAEFEEQASVLKTQLDQQVQLIVDQLPVGEPLTEENILAIANVDGLQMNYFREYGTLIINMLGPIVEENNTPPIEQEVIEEWVDDQSQPPIIDDGSTPLPNEPEVIEEWVDDQTQPPVIEEWVDVDDEESTSEEETTTSEDASDEESTTSEDETTSEDNVDIDYDETNTDNVNQNGQNNNNNQNNIIINNNVPGQNGTVIDTTDAIPIEYETFRYLNPDLEPGEEKVVVQGREGLMSPDGYVLRYPQNEVIEYNPEENDESTSSEEEETTSSEDETTSSEDETTSSEDETTSSDDETTSEEDDNNDPGPIDNDDETNDDDNDDDNNNGNNNNGNNNNNGSNNNNGGSNNNGNNNNGSNNNGNNNNGSNNNNGDNNNGNSNSDQTPTNYATVGDTVSIRSTDGTYRASILLVSGEVVGAPVNAQHSLRVNYIVRNDGDQTVSVSPNQFSLTSTDGENVFSLDPQQTGSTGRVEPGQQLQGSVYFTIPEGQNEFLLHWEPFGDGVTATFAFAQTADNQVVEAQTLKSTSGQQEQALATAQTTADALPETGESTSFWVVFAAALLAFGGAALLFFNRRRNKMNEDEEIIEEEENNTDDHIPDGEL